MGTWKVCELCFSECLFLVAFFFFSSQVRASLLLQELIMKARSMLLHATSSRKGQGAWEQRDGCFGSEKRSEGAWAGIRAEVHWAGARNAGKDLVSNPDLKQRSCFARWGCAAANGGDG